MARSSDAVFPLSLIRDPSFKRRQIRRVLLLAAFFIVQSTLLLGVFWHMLLGDMVAGNAPLLFASEDIHSLGEHVPSVGAVMLRWLGLMLAINALLTGALCVWMARRLGTPVLAIERVLNEIGDGNLDVRLRAEDMREFGELATALNRALEQVQGRVRTARELTDVLDEQPAPGEVVMHTALTECREVLGWFDRRAANSDAGGVRRDRRTDRIGDG